MKKRIVSLPMVLVLCLALCLTLLPTSAFAAEGSGETIDTSGLCEHHTAHDDTCGYVEGIAETPCTHEHSEECYTEVTSCIHEHTEDCYPAVDNGIPDDVATSSDDESVEDTIHSEAAEPTECSHVCSEENGCIKQELDCRHEHDDECGYVPAVEGQPCTYDCTLCGLTEITAWSWVDELEAINPENGVLALSASAESPTRYAEIIALLPTEITATTQDGEETIALGGWTCPDYPDAGAYTGSYTFNASLPEGYGLTADAPALTVTVEFGGVAMLADGETHSHPICGASGASCTHGSLHNNIVFDKKLAVGDNGLAVNGTYLSSSYGHYELVEGNYYLSENITLNKPIWVLSSNVNLCLNGYTITMSSNNPVFQISNYNVATLNLTDCSAGKTGMIKHDGNTSTSDNAFGVRLMKGNFNMYGGTITGNRCGVFMFLSGEQNPSQVFNMYGGSITGNNSSYTADCGGVYFYQGTMNLYGSPVITGNTANGKACNLWLNSGKTVTIDSLTEGADIGVSTAQTPTSSVTVDITGTCGADYSSYFQPDGEYCEIRNNGKRNTVELAMKKSDLVYTAPTAITGLTYNGQAQELINPGKTYFGEMQYRLDNGTYSTTIPTATDAGTYIVYYKIIGDATHNDVAETRIDVIIRQATPTGTPTFTPVTEAGKTLADAALTAPDGWPKGSLFWVNGNLTLSSDTPVTQDTSYHWIFLSNDNNYTSTGGYLVLWPSTGGGNSGGNSGGGNSSNTGSSGGGNSSDNGDSDSDNSSSNTNTLPTPVTVPVSGDEKTIQVDAAVSGSTAAIKNVDLSKLDTVIGDNVKTGIITIDFSALKKVDTVKLPSNVVKQIAEAVNDPNNDAKGLEIVLTNGTSIEFSAKALGDKTVQANGADIIISLKRIADSSLNSKQKLAVGNRPALNINVTIGGKPISDMNGKVTVSASYELKPGEHASGIVVYYIDTNGNRKLCETSYDPISKRVSWKTSQLSPSSVYMIGYDESRVKPGSGAYVTYTVQKGNTLSMIAKKHGCTVAEILAANSGLIKNPNRIYVGWQFKIPQD